MPPSPSLPHWPLALGLLVLAGPLGLLSGHPLEALVGLLAAAVAVAGAIPPARELVPVTVRVEP